VMGVQLGAHECKLQDRQAGVWHHGLSTTWYGPAREHFREAAPRAAVFVTLFR
jgi:hypothetical protein